MKTDKELEKAIDEIVPNLHSPNCNDYWYSQIRKPFEERICFCGGIGQEKKLKKELLSLFHSYALRIIGEDESEYAVKQSASDAEKNCVRNDLRAEQRKRI